MSIVRKAVASACAVVAAAGISVIGAQSASATVLESANRCVKVSVDYTRTGPSTWNVVSATVANNCGSFYGHFQLTGPTFNLSNPDAPTAVGFYVPLNQTWTGSAPNVCGTAWFKVTPSYWTDYGFACVTLV
ncbi:hypothetical protein JOD54_001374 [Actinokineospora baliensis]|uniref:hypothetical protein n=1 Tax=Actinokineospora baliensis TaxID=547056 RepID=UPI00195C82EE|nr:hypothetical protein [Actinokineospora baliensis]MBM7771170.1 hypothetical protein [Actinokineospora baliensis]